MNWQDKAGYPGTQSDDGNFDGGDTAAIVGKLIALGSPSITGAPLVLLRSTLLQPRGLVRHPDATKWYGQVDRFSRDQLIPILCSFVGQNADLDGRLPQDFDLKQVYRFHKRNYFMRAWNTKGNGAIDMPEKAPDITGPEVWALWFRVLNKRMTLLLWLLDIETLVGAIIWRWFTPKTNRVSANHMLVCLTGMKKFPTLTMRLANWINDWEDLLSRWEAHTEAVKEFPTAQLFRRAVSGALTLP